MSKQHCTKSRTSTRRHYHRTHNRYRTQRQRACQKSHNADRVAYITSLLGFAMYVLFAIMLVIACYATQNYTMLPIINVIAHDIGYAVRHMVESVYAQMLNQHSVNKKQKFLEAPKKASRDS